MKRYVEHVMGMPVSLAVRGDACDDAWAAVMDDLRWADEGFSTYKPESYVSRLARGEIAVQDCPPEVAEVLELGVLAEQVSEGAFSIRRPELDPSGVVKGWAVERAARQLAGREFCLSAGGDLICHSDDEPWRIGIEHPHDPTRLIATVPVRSGAVATSGFAHRGVHVVDARTGVAPDGVASVTVIGPSLTWTDIDATAAFALDQRAVQWLRDRRRTGLVVWSDGSTTVVGPADDQPTAPVSMPPSSGYCVG